MVQGDSFEGLEDNKMLQDVDWEQYKRILEWKRYYKGKEEEDEYVTVSGRNSRKKNELKMGRVISNQMATLVFNERVEINTNGDVDKYIQDVLKDSRFYSQMQGYIEYMFALGGLVLKPYYCFKSKSIKISYITADSFLILKERDGYVEDIVFLKDVKIEGRDYLHLEYHLESSGQYEIRNELYLKMESKYSRVDLGVLDEELEQSVILEGFEGKMYTYIKPNIANNYNIRSSEGISIFANELDTIDTIDRVFDSLEREFKLGKKRILVPSKYINAVIDKETGREYRYYDTEDEVYEVFNSGMDEDEGIKEIDVSLRVEEHVKALEALLDILSESTGFTAGTFNVRNGQSIRTATEVVSENSKTFKSKRSHEINLEEGIKELIGIILELSEYYNLYEYNGKEELEVVVKFDDSIVEDFGTDLEYEKTMLDLGVQSKIRAIKKLHRVTEEEAREILEEIEKEQEREEDIV